MNFKDLLKTFLSSSGPNKIEPYLQLMNFASEHRLTEELIKDVFNALDTATPSETIVLIHLLSKQALFQSPLYASNQLQQTFNQIQSYPSHLVLQFIDSLNGFVAHEACSRWVIQFIIDQVQTQLKSTYAEAYQKAINQIIKAHPTLEGIELLKHVKKR